MTVWSYFVAYDDTFNDFKSATKIMCLAHNIQATMLMRLEVYSMRLPFQRSSMKSGSVYTNYCRCLCKLYKLHSVNLYLHFRNSPSGYRRSLDNTGALLRMKIELYRL